MTRRRQRGSRPDPAAATILLLAAAAAHGDTWLRDVTVAPEAACDTYTRSAWSFDARDHRDFLAAELDAAPYSGTPVPAQPAGRDWHVEHAVALKEAAESGLCGAGAAVLREFANDRRNLTLALAAVNLSKGAKDAAEWLPATADGRCWLARTVVRVKGAWGLTVDQAEADRLERVFLDGDCGSSFSAYWSLVDPRRLISWRTDYRAHRQRAREERARERLQAQREREAATRSAPARAWRIGRVLFWTAAPTAAENRPTGYWVSEGGSMHGDYVPHRDDREHVYEARLFRMNSEARVETYYANQVGLLGPRYSTSAGVGAGPSHLIGVVRSFAISHPRKIGRDRWRRVLAGFRAPCGIGHAGRPPVCPLEPPMTAAEAQTYADRRWSRWWHPVADALRRLEGEFAP